MDWKKVLPEMTITQITELNRTRSKIYIDGEPAFVLYKGEIRSYGIAEGTELSDETYHTIIHEVLSKRAKLRCMNLLKTRDYTTEQIRQKLKEGFYPQENIEEAIAYVTSFHYLDDERYVRGYISYHINDRSRRRIEADLTRKGIDKQQIERVYEEIAGEGEEDLEEQQIYEFLKKKSDVLQADDGAQKQKLIGKLYRKGFALDKIYKVIKKFDV